MKRVQEDVNVEKNLRLLIVIPVVLVIMTIQIVNHVNAILTVQGACSVNLKMDNVLVNIITVENIVKNVPISIIIFLNVNVSISVACNFAFESNIKLLF